MIYAIKEMFLNKENYQRFIGPIKSGKSNTVSYLFLINILVYVSFFDVQNSMFCVGLILGYLHAYNFEESWREVIHLVLFAYGLFNDEVKRMQKEY
jgi:hypothetical protein